MRLCYNAGPGDPMAEPFKNLIAPALVRTAARHLRRVWSAFPQQRFEQMAVDGLERLELKQRVRHVATALAATLPDDFPRAADVLEAVLAPPRDDTDLGALRCGADGLAGWIVWPMTEFVAQRGLAQPVRALRALHALTQRSTAEFAIRPFLIEHEALTLATLRAWLDDPSAHVRRLVSEGSRPRLPWGIRLQRFCADPAPTLPLLERLQDDPSDYVRRSVANHLNDIAKDHPEVVVAWLARHLPAAPSARRALLKHASRTLVKKGHRAVLAAWGVDRALRGEATLTIEPARVRIGGEVTLTVELHSRSRSAQALVVDYVVHQVRRGGATSPKVWKGWTPELAAGERRTLRKRHSCKPVTTRVDHPGHHAVDLRINGRLVAQSGFELCD